MLCHPRLGAHHPRHRAQLVCGVAAVRPAGLLLHLCAVGQLAVHHHSGGGSLHPADWHRNLLLPAHLDSGDPGEAAGQAGLAAQNQAARFTQLPHHVCGVCALCRLLGAAEPDRPGGGSGLQVEPGHTGVAVHCQLLHGVLQQLPERRHLRCPESQLQEGVQEDRLDHLQVPLLR